MICFVTAFPAEAKPMIKRYGFKAFQSNPFPIYESDIGFLVISGMGKKSAAKAVSHLATLYPANSIWINIGVAGHRDAEIGTAFLAHKIVDLKTGKNWYPQILFSPKCKTATVITVDQCETGYAQDAAYDMEVAGFYEEAARFSTAELIHSFKVISDNVVSPVAKISPKLAETLIEKNLEALNHLVEELTALRETLPTHDPNLLKEFLDRWHFTVTELHQLCRALSRLRTLAPKENWFLQVFKLPNAKKVLNFLDQQINTLPVHL